MFIISGENVHVLTCFSLSLIHTQQILLFTALCSANLHLTFLPRYQTKHYHHSDLALPRPQRPKKNKWLWTTLHAHTTHTSICLEDAEVHPLGSFMCKKIPGWLIIRKNKNNLTQTKIIRKQVNYICRHYIMI